MGFGSIQVKFLKPIKGKKDIYYHSGFDKFYKASQGEGFFALKYDKRLRKELNRKAHNSRFLMRHK